MQRHQSVPQVHDLDLLTTLLSTPPAGDDLLLGQLLVELPPAHPVPLRRVAVTPRMTAPRLTRRRLVAYSHRSALTTGRLAMRSAQWAGALLLAGAALLAGGSPLMARAAAPERAPAVAVIARAPGAGLLDRMPAMAGAAPRAVPLRAAPAATLARLPDFELAPAVDAPAVAVSAGLAARMPATVAEYRPPSIGLPAIDYSTAAAQELPPTPYPEDAPPPPAPPEQPPAAQPPVAQAPVEIYRPAPARPVARPTAQTRPATLGTTYTVHPGDYLRLISHWYYGNERYWPTIWDANYRVIGPNPDLIYPGQRYQIPARATSAATRPAALRPISGSYVVRPGDTLSAIALARYGNADLWPQIYWANSAQIGPNPGNILAGSTLVIP